MASTKAKSIYNMYDFRRYVDQGNFNLVMNVANQKYNSVNSRQAMWRLLGDWDAPSDSKVWSQGQKTIPIMARASLLSTHALKPMRNTTGWKFYTGSTPKMGHGFTFGEDDMFILRDAKNNTGQPLQTLIYDSIITNSRNILGGIHNELTHMCMELASTSEIHEQSVDGVKYDFTYEFDQNQFFEVNPAWFTEGSDGKVTPNANANVIKDIIDMQRTLTSSQGRDVNAWMMHTDTLDMILDHPAVLTQFLAWKSNGTATGTTYPATRVEIANFLHDRGVWPFMPIDFKSVHEEDGKPVEDEPAFSPYTMVAFNSGRKLFDIKCTNSIWKDRQQYGGIGNNTLYSFVEDRIAVLSTWNENPIHNTTEFELYAAPVFKNLADYGLVTLYRPYGG